MTDPRIGLIESGYDTIADRFLEWRDRIEGDQRERYRAMLASRLPDGARVLDLGCGAGIPDTSALAERFRVTGVDISGEQLARARLNVPSAEFVQADLTTLAMEPESFDAVAAFYVLNHVPRELLGTLTARIHSWLVPNGVFLGVFGTSDNEAWTGSWLGTDMFFSSFEPDTNRRVLLDAGFELVIDEIVTMREPEPDGEGQWHWVLAKK